MSALSLTIKTLLAEPSITAITSTRIWPHNLPVKGGLPAIVVRLMGEDDPQHLAGSDRFPMATVALHCIASSMATADALGEAVKLALRDKLATHAGVEVQFMKTGTDFTDFDPADNSSRRVISFACRYR